MVIEKALKKIVSLNKSSEKKLASYGESIILTSRSGRQGGGGSKARKVSVFNNFSQRCHRILT